MTSTNNNSPLIRTEIVALLAITGLAVFTRLYGLGDWDYLVDEYATVEEAANRMTKFRNPAYYALVFGFFEMFGASEFSARLPAMLFGVASVPLFYLTWRNVIGRYGAGVGALLIVFSSWHLWFSQFSRFYSAVFFFGSLAFYLYWRALSRDSARLLAAALACCVAGVAFHTTMIFAPMAFAATALAVIVAPQKLGLGLSGRIARITLACCVLGGLVLLPVLLSRLGEWQGIGQHWGYGPAEILVQTAKYVQLPIAIAALLGVLSCLRHDTGLGVLLFTGAAVPVVALLVLSFITSVRPDYMFFALPLVFVAVGYLSVRLAGALGFSVFAGHALPIVIVFSMLAEFVSHYTGHASVDVRETVAYVERDYRASDRVLGLVSGVQYYSEGRLAMEHRPGSVYDKSVGWPAVLQDYTLKPGRLWIIAPVRRGGMTPELEDWLRQNAVLKWRKLEKRYDYTIRGLEIYLVDGRA